MLNSTSSAIHPAFVTRLLPKDLEFLQPNSREVSVDFMHKKAKPLRKLFPALPNLRLSAIRKAVGCKHLPQLFNFRLDRSKTICSNNSLDDSITTPS